MRFLTLILFFFSAYTFAQKSEVFRIDSLPTAGVQLNKGWKFQTGDNPEWAKPEFDDTAWDTINPTLTIPVLKQIDTHKPLWLRLELSSQNPKSVTLSVKQSGASEIFLNGKLLKAYGNIENKETKTIAYNPLNEQVILNLDSTINTLAIRYYFQKDLKYDAMFGERFPLFSAQLNSNKFQVSEAEKYAWEGFNIGVPFILFIIHLIFYLYYTPAKTNLWYSLSSFFGFLGSYILFNMKVSHGIEDKNTLINYAVVFSMFNIIFLFYTIYLFLKQKNKWLLIVFISLSFISLFNEFLDFIEIGGFVFYVYVAFVLYMSIQANKQGIQGAKSIIVGLVFYGIFWSLFLLSLQMQGLHSSSSILFHLATLTLPIIISTLLGLEFKNTNLALIKNLKEVNSLSNEKQQILFTQNETLEKQVTERTAELQHSLNILKATQTQLIQSEKLASLGELTAGIAHEIQNPLNFVNNFSELSVDLVKDLKDEMGKPDIDKEYIGELFEDLSQNQEKINHHGKRASSIVKGMLEHSRASTGVRELTDINKLADEYLRLSYHGLRAKDKDFNADFTTDFDENLPKIEVIPQDIGRVLLNLINNAFYAVNQRKLLLNDDNYTPSVSMTTQQLDNQIIIKVKDNGTGMSESVRAKVFQPFFTTKPTGSGTGLGLSLAYDIVTKGHGGTLEVESTEGVGSEFIIHLSSS